MKVEKNQRRIELKENSNSIDNLKKTNINKENKDKIWKKNKLKDCFENIQGLALEPMKRGSKEGKKKIISAKPNVTG